MASTAKRPSRSWRGLLSRYWWVLPLVIVLSAVGASVYLATYRNRQTLVACANTSRAQEFECWRQRYEYMVTHQPTKDAFTDVEAAYESIGYVKTNCHQIAHVIGRTAGRKHGDVTKAFAEGDDFCWSGYYHGVMEAMAAQMGPSKILAQINTICAGLKATKEFSFDHYNCVHGLGHGVLAVQESELFTALNTCTAMDGNWQQESCYSGVFMENVMNEINPGHSTKYLKKDDPLYPCTAVEDRFKQQCYLMQTSHALLVTRQDYKKVFELCTGVAAPYDATCFQSLGRDISGNSSSNQNQTEALCMQGATQAAKSNCFIGAVKDFISYHHSDTQGLALCNALNEPELQQVCLSTAQEYYKTF